MAETIMEKLAGLSEKREDVRKARDKWVTSIIENDEEMFEHVSKNKSRDTLIAESTADAEGYEDKADDNVLTESLLEEGVTPQIQSESTQEESQ